MSVRTGKFHGSLRRTLPLAAVLMAASAVAGCKPPPIDQGEGLAVGPRMIVLEDLAAQLGMYVADAGRSGAVLRNSANTVVLYPDPEGEVYVNGSALPGSSGVVAQGDSLLVPSAVVWQIRTSLRYVGVPQPEPVAPPPLPPVERPRPPRTVVAGRVVVDPGHGGKDPGATSVLGAREKDLVLEVARRVANELRARGAEVILTRDGDEFLELESRPAIADRARADVFVSIHADHAPNRAAQGFTVYVDRTPNRASLAAARAILRRMCDSCEPSRGLKNADYRVLTNSNRPAVLIELGFLSNRPEAARLGSRSYQQQLASAIAEGIADYLRAR